jgi:hypothetical protein
MAFITALYDNLTKAFFIHPKEPFSSDKMFDIPKEINQSVQQKFSPAHWNKVFSVILQTAGHYNIHNAFY